MLLRHIAAAVLCGAALATAGAQNPLPDISGEWDGLLIGRLHLIVKLEKAGDGSLRGSLQCPEHGPAIIRIDTVKLDGAKTVALELNGIHAVFEGKLTDDSAEIGGQWKQGAQSLPLILRRPGVAPKTTLPPVTRGRVALKPCRSADDTTEGLCGTYEVFENRTTRAGRKIALHGLLLPAAEGRIRPRLYAGRWSGQGAAETFPASDSPRSCAHTAISCWWTSAERASPHAQLRALADPKDAQAIVATLFPPEALKTCRAALAEHADLTQYTTSIAVDDLDEVRLALGYGKIDVLGGSYGSRVALEFLRRHPEAVRALVLSQVVPPGYKLGVFAATIQASMERLLSDCATDAACSKSFPNLRAEYRMILERLEKAPAQFAFYNPEARTSQQITLPRGMFVANLRPILYIPELASALPYMIHQAFENDWGAYTRAPLFAANSGIYSALARGMSFSVVCAEDVPFVSGDDVRRETGTDLGSFLIPIYQAACAIWRVAKRPKISSRP